jgi:hypothetical protein
MVTGAGSQTAQHKRARTRQPIHSDTDSRQTSQTPRPATQHRPAKLATPPQPATPTARSAPPPGSAPPAYRLRIGHRRGAGTPGTETEMAQKIGTFLIEDLDGDEAAGTVRLGLDDAQYKIDLSSRHAGDRRNALTPTSTSAARPGRVAAREARRRRPGQHGDPRPGREHAASKSRTGDRFPATSSPSTRLPPAFRPPAQEGPGPPGTGRACTLWLRS